MGEKNPRDMLSKASWTLMEGMKDAVSTNVTQALRASQLDIKPEEVTKLMAIINASLEEGYHRGFRSYCKVVDQAVVAAPAALAREQSTAKKNAGRP